MSRTNTWVLVAVSVIVAAGGWLSLLGADDAKPPDKTSDTPVAKPAAEAPAPAAPAPANTPSTPAPAQAPAKPVVNRIIDPAADSRETAVERALAKRTDLNCSATPLSGVAAKIAKLAGVDVFLDTKALKEAGISADLPITCDIRDVSLGAGLRFMLAQNDLGYCLDGDNVLVITTIDKTKEREFIRVYDVLDLITDPMPSSEFSDITAAADFDTLINVIMSTVPPQSWETSGGGQIQPFDGSIVLSQTLQVHHQIADLLAALRKARGQQAGANEAGFMPVGVDPGADRIEQLLEVRRDVDFFRPPLKDHPGADVRQPSVRDLLKYLHQQGFPAQIDQKKLDDAGVKLDAQLSEIHLKHVPLRLALRQVLGEIDLSYIVRDEMLIISTSDAEKETVRTVVYPVGYLVNDPGNPSGTSPQEKDFLSLTDLIASAVRPTTWDGSGASSSFIPSLAAADALVISQSEEAHDDIAQLLAKLRAVRRNRIDAAAKEAAEAKNKDEVVVRTYMMVNRDDKSVDQVIASITKLIEPKSWTGDTAYLGKIPGGIIVRQTRAVQQRIANLLQEIQGIASPPVGAAGRVPFQGTGLGGNSGFNSGMGAGNRGGVLGGGGFGGGFGGKQGAGGAFDIRPEPVAK